MLSPLTGIMDPGHFEPNRTFLENYLKSTALKYPLRNDIPDVVKDDSEFNNPDNFEKLRKGLTQIYSDFMFNVPMLQAFKYHNSIVKESKHSYLQ